MNEEGMDEGATRRSKKRYAELAGMLKEKMAGSLRCFERIVARFAIQEGLTPHKAKVYADSLESAGLVKWTNGRKHWRYDSEAEWELFKVTI